MAWRDILAALVLLAASAWYGWLTAALPERSLPNTPGPSFFPTVIVVMVVLLSGAMLLRGLMALRAGGESHPASSGASKIRLTMLAAFLVYLGLLPAAGFVLSSVAFFAVLMILYGSRNAYLVVALSVAVPVALYVVFRYGLQIILPNGPLGF